MPQRHFAAAMRRATIGHDAKCHCTMSLARSAASYASTGVRFPGDAMRGKGLLLSLLIVCVGAFAPLASAGLVGIPPFSSFSPDLDVYPQNFAVTQDAQGIVYVGNTNGV